MNGQSRPFITTTDSPVRHLRQSSGRPYIRRPGIYPPVRPYVHQPANLSVRPPICIPVRPFARSYWSYDSAGARWQLFLQWWRHHRTWMDRLLIPGMLLKQIQSCYLDQVVWTLGHDQALLLLATGSRPGSWPAIESRLVAANVDHRVSTRFHSGHQVSTRR